MDSGAHLGLIGVPGNPPSAFVAYVRIPSGTTREQYIRHCYSTNTISLLTSQNENHHHVIIGDAELERIIFPIDNKQVGSPVLCITLPIVNVPVVSSVLKHTDAAQTIFKEISHRIVLQDELTYVDVHFNGASGTLDAVLHSGDQTGVTTVRFLNSANKARVDFDVQGVFNFQVDDIIQFAALNGFGIKLGPEDKRKILALLPDGLFYEDDFKNKLIIDSSGFNYSYNGTSQKALLGEDTLEFMKDGLQAIMKLTVPTFAGPSGVPINIMEFQNLLLRADTLLSKFTKFA